MQAPITYKEQILARVLLEDTQASDVPEETMASLIRLECMQVHQNMMYALMLTIYRPTLGQFTQSTIN